MECAKWLEDGACYQLKRQSHAISRIDSGSSWDTKTCYGRPGLMCDRTQGAHVVRGSGGHPAQ